MKRHLQLPRQLTALLASLVLLVASCGQGHVQSVRPDGRQVIDVREPAEFATGHHFGALNIQLSYDQLSARTRSYVPYLSTRLALRASGPDEASRANEILRELGYEDVVVVGKARHPVFSRTITALELQSAFDDEQPPVVIDVREPEEHATGVIPGAILVDPDKGPESVDHLDRSLRYAIICAGGWRSSQLQSWMEGDGFANVQNVIDGMGAWNQIPDAPLERD